MVRFLLLRRQRLHDCDQDIYVDDGLYVINFINYNDPARPIINSGPAC